jgi:hypothetical protein
LPVGSNNAIVSNTVSSTYEGACVRPIYRTIFVV